MAVIHLSKLSPTTSLSGEHGGIGGYLIQFDPKSYPTSGAFDRSKILEFISNSPPARIIFFSKFTGWEFDYSSCPMGRDFEFSK